MATLDLRIEVAEADMPRLLSAARAVFENPEMTEAEIVERVRQHGITLIQQMVRNYERRIAIAAAEALDPKLEVK